MSGVLVRRRASPLLTFGIRLSAKPWKGKHMSIFTRQGRSKKQELRTVSDASRDNTGGAQERKRRAGTENVPGIVGLGAAIEKAAERIAVDMPKVAALRDKLIEGIESTIPEVKLNGHRQNRLPNNVNISIKYIEGESVLMMLDMLGIAASSGSACASASIDPSHVLLAMGIPHETAHGSIRLTLSDKTTEEEIDYVIKTLPTVVERLRKMSPLYNK